jgi:hypothetical protein
VECGLGSGEELADGGAGVADEVGEADAAIAVAEEGEVAEGLDAGVEGGHALEVADFVLGEATGPAADGGEGGVGRWERAEDGFELGEGGGGDVGVGGVGEVLGGAGAEEGAEDAGAGRGAVGEFLVDEGGSEEWRR